MVETLRIDYHGTTEMNFSVSRGDVVVLDFHPYREIVVTRYDLLGDALRAIFKTPDEVGSSPSAILDYFARIGSIDMPAQLTAAHRRLEAETGARVVREEDIAA